MFQIPLPYIRVLWCFLWLACNEVNQLIDNCVWDCKIVRYYSSCEFYCWNKNILQIPLPYIRVLWCFHWLACNEVNQLIDNCILDCKIVRCYSSWEFDCWNKNILQVFSFFLGLLCTCIYMLEVLLVQFE